MAIYNLQVIIFRAVDYGETSQILTAFSREQGLISIMARGVKNPKSKKHNLVAPYTESYLELNKSKDFYYLKDGEIINDNLHLRQSLKQIYLTQVFFDIIEATSLKDEQLEDQYLLLSKTLKYFSGNYEKDYDLKIANMFLIKYISMIGYKPNFRTCTICGTNKFKEIYFSHQTGGVLCQNHYEIGAISLNFAEYEYLIQILLQIFENIGIIVDEIDEKKMFKLISEFILYNTAISMPKSLKMLNKLIGIQ